MRQIVIILAVLYFSTIFTGPLPISVSGVKLEHLLAGSLGALFVTSALLRAAAPRSAIVIIGAFCILLSPSVLAAQDSTRALTNYISMAGYGFIFLAAPGYLRGYRESAYKWLIVMGAIFVVAFAIMSVIELSEGLSRITASKVTDPNHTAFGLGILFILLIERQALGLSLKKMRLLVIGAAGLSLLILMSRTVLLGLVLSLTLSIFIALIRLGPRAPVTKESCIVLCLLLLLGCILLIDMPLFEPLRDKFVNSVELFLRDNRRGGLIVDSFNLYFASKESWLWGIGYFETNPHNEYVRYLTNAGLLGFAWLMAMLVWLYRYTVESLSEMPKVYVLQNWIFWFAVLYLFTYGHTKTFWIGPFFLVFHRLLSIEESRRQSNPSRRYTSTRGEHLSRY
jgi:hypothetical protein